MVQRLVGSVGGVDPAAAAEAEAEAEASAGVRFSEN